MIDRTDLEQSIKEWESYPASFQTVEKLADLYTVYNHLFGKSDPEIIEGDSEFLQLAARKNLTEVMSLMDELMESVQILNVKLYDGVMQRLSELSWK